MHLENIYFYLKTDNKELKIHKTNKQKSIFFIKINHFFTKEQILVSSDTIKDIQTA